jgi:D-threo-aldose 1-dehydrogenase
MATSAGRVRRSVEESRERLGLEVLPLVHLHDPEFFDWDLITAPGGAVDTLAELRTEGVIGHIGLAGGPVDQMDRYLDLGVFEVLLVHNRWTLVDRSAGAILKRAADAGMGIVNAAIYGGGILAAPRRGLDQYGYRPATEATLAAIAAMADLCDEFGTDLPTAALQFSLRDPRIHTTVVGISKASRLDGLLRAAGTELPEPFWERIEAHVPAPANWLEAP